MLRRRSCERCRALRHATRDDRRRLRTITLVKDNPVLTSDVWVTAEGKCRCEQSDWLSSGIAATYLLSYLPRRLLREAGEQRLIAPLRLTAGQALFTVTSARWTYPS